MLFVIFVQDGDNMFVTADNLAAARQWWNDQFNIYGMEGPGYMYEYGGRPATSEEIHYFNLGYEFRDIPVW